ncbi:TetR/AcrR family transcriptional regulator [Aestuariibius sp. HNIBRBA575]|uniref:TetR/AcrR family transcriptional regulator n=1 Tax=Aestuariibius sp. HNIBRBA575 TaxID=3233343 RepID=UPI0034A5A258
MPDGTTTEVKRGRKFDQVIEGAREVFMRDGFEGASVDDIAKAAGVSKATLYSYFPDKGALFMQVTKTECERQATDVLESVDLTAAPRDVLTNIATQLVDFFCCDFGQETYRINVAESPRFPDMGRAFYEMVQVSVIGPLKAYFQAAIDRNELAIEDLDLAACQFEDLCRSQYFIRLIMQVQDHVTPEERERVVVSAVDMFLARYGK